MDPSRYRVLSTGRKHKVFIKVAMFFTIIFAAVFALGSVAEELVDWDSYRKRIEDSLTAMFNARVTIDGKIEGSILLPKLKVYRVRVDHGDDFGVSIIETMNMRISPLSVILFDPKISSVVVDGASFSMVNVFNFVENETLDSQGKGIVLTDTVLGFVGGMSVFSDIKIKQAKLAYSGDSFMLLGDFAVGDGLYRVDFKSHGRGFDVVINSDHAKVTMNLKDGQGEIKGSGDRVIPLFSDVFGFGMTQAASSGFSLGADVHMSDGKYELNNIKIDADSFQMNGKVLWSDENHVAKIHIGEFNFDNLVHKNTGSDEHVGRELLSMLNYLENVIPEDGEGDFLLSAKSVIFRGEKIEDFLLRAIMHSGTLKLDAMTATLPGNSTLNVLGSVTSDGLGSKFEGDVAIIGNDAKSTLAWLSMIDPGLWSEGESLLDFRAKFVALPGLVSVSDFVAKVGESHFSGALKFQDGLGLGLFSGILVGDRVDFGKYSVIAFDPMEANKLRNRGIGISLEVDLYNSLFRDYLFSSLSFYVDSGEGTVLFDHVQFVSDNTKFGGQVKIGQNNLRSFIDVELTGASLDLSLLGEGKVFEVLPVDNYEAGNKQIKWSQDQINWFGIRDMDGRISTTFDKVISGSHDLNNFVMNLDLSNSVISIEKFEFGALGEGVITVVGNVGIEEEASLSLSFAANNLDLSQALEAFEVGSASGGMSCNGSLRSRGKNVEHLIENLSGVINFSCRDVVVSGIDSDRLVNNLFSVKSRAELATMTQVFLFEGDTIYRTVDGSANISGGVMAASLQFLTDRASGFFSSNFSLLRFVVNGVVRYFFINSNTSSEVTSIDMNVQGSVWRPKIFFDNDALYNLIISKR